LAPRDIFAPLHAAEVLLDLPAGEYRLALARMADYMRNRVVDPALPRDQKEAARSALRELEQRLG